MSGPGSIEAGSPRTTSALRWAVLCLSAAAVFSTYYEADAIGPIADMLGRQRGLSQLQIGELTAVISLPNIPLAVISGLLIDRYGPVRVVLWSAILGLIGALLTAMGSSYDVMWTGRLIFGVCDGAIFIALIATLAQWFGRGAIALATAVFLSLARLGSFTLDVSPTWARPLYDAGWQPPLWLGAGIMGGGLIAAVLLRVIDSRQPQEGPAQAHAPFSWSMVRGFDASYWYILGLHVLYAAVFFPFRQTFAIEYLQHAKHLSLQDAGTVNSGVFAAAILGTPIFGLLAARLGHRALLLTLGTLLLPAAFVVLGATQANAWVSTVMMGVSFALVTVIIWPSTTLLVPPQRLGVALGLITLLQNLCLWASNRSAGWLADLSGASAANPRGYDTMLIYFGILSLTALTSAALLWHREAGPKGHGLEQAGTRHLAEPAPL